MTSLNQITGISLLLCLLALPGAAAASGTGIKHIVLCWLNEAGDAASMDMVMQTSRQLESIPLVDNIVVGKTLSSDREIVDDSFDVGIVMNFRTQQDLEDYLVHPEHVRRVRETLAPQCQRILVYDIVF